MAEAILVMTILGIIAAVMITTLKPAEFKEKSLRVLAKKVLSEIDTATTQILSNDAKLGTMTSLSLSDGAQFEFKGNADKVLSAEEFAEYEYKMQIQEILNGLQAQIALDFSGDLAVISSNDATALNL